MSEFSAYVEHIQLIQLKLSFQKHKLLTMNFTMNQGIMDYCLFSPNAQRITFVANKLVVQSFLWVLNAVSKK